MHTAAVLTTSDLCSKGQREDTSGKTIQEIIKKHNFQVTSYEVVSDDLEMIKKKLIHYCDNLKVDLVLTTGGTGLTPRDITPEATKTIIDRDVPGIAETMRLEGYKVTKRAVLSRGISGLRGKTLIINLPGSPKGARESLEAILDILPHGMDMIANLPH